VKSLGFGDGLRDGPTGKRVRRAQFEARSALPTSAACVVANGVREALSTLLRASVVLKLFEPSIPSPQAWTAILYGARLYRVRGNVADAAVVLRAPDALALATALFGESDDFPPDERALSPIECDVVDRMAGALAANLGTVCGAREGHAVERVAAIAGFVTFFELCIEEPVTARIGIALSRDPFPEPHGALEIGHLAEVRVSVSASLDAGTVETAAIARLQAGAIVPLEVGGRRHCRLAVQGRNFMQGTCGVRSGRYAVALEQCNGR